MLRELTTNGYRAFVPTCAYIASGLRFKRSRVERTIDGDLRLSEANKIAVYVHYDASGQVHGYVENQVWELKNAGFCVLFVTNSKKLDAASIALLKPLVGQILCRKNIGYDFGAYKDGILSIKHLETLDALLIANDSVYGPFRPLDAILNADEIQDADVISITDSWEIRYHLQSYFMLFNKAVLIKPDFRQFWSDLRYINNKIAVVHRYEVGLTRVLLKLGLKCTALYPYEVAAKMMYDELSLINVNSKSFCRMPQQEQNYILALIRSLSAGVPLNGTHFLWQQLVLEMGCPFIKRELLSVNPVKVPNLIRFEDLLREVSDYDFDLVREHLKFVNRMRSL